MHGTPRAEQMPEEALFMRFFGRIPVPGFIW
jgi:hypothetical protein